MPSRVRAWVAEVPDIRASQSLASPEPRARWAPQPAARSAARALAAPQAFSVRASRPRLLQLLLDPDPFLRQAAVWRLAHGPDLLGDYDGQALEPRQRLGLLLARRART